MSLRATIENILTRIATIAELKTVEVFNNQLEETENGQYYGTDYPCVYLEIVAPAQYIQIGNGCASAVLIYRVHIAFNQYDAGGAKLNQNLDIYTFKDKINKLLTGYQPPQSSHMQKGAESADYSHKSLYHYILEFKSEFIDVSGSIYDPETTELIELDPPIELIINATINSAVRGWFNNDFNNDFNLTAPLADPGYDLREYVI